MSLPAVDAEPNDDLVEAPHGDLVELSAEDEPVAPNGKENRKPDATYHRVILGLCVSVLALSLLMSVRERTQVLIPGLGVPLPELCHMRRYVGVDCPGCGLTRSFISLAHGRVMDAWRYNPGAFLLFPLMLIQIPLRSAQLWRLRNGRPEGQMGWGGRGAVLAVVSVLLAQWVVRQLGVGF